MKKEVAKMLLVALDRVREELSWTIDQVVALHNFGHLRLAQRNSAPSLARHFFVKKFSAQKFWRARLGAEFLCACLIY